LQNKHTRASPPGEARVYRGTGAKAPRATSSRGEGPARRRSLRRRSTLALPGAARRSTADPRRALYPALHSRVKDQWNDAGGRWAVRGLPAELAEYLKRRMTQTAIGLSEETMQIPRDAFHRSLGFDPGAPPCVLTSYGVNCPRRSSWRPGGYDLWGTCRLREK